MNLDDHAAIDQIDQQHMLSQIDSLPSQLEEAWDLGSRLTLPDWQGIQQVVIAGMGGSAIGGDLVAAYAASFGEVSITVQRDYGLPAWAKGTGTLVIAVSHSGNTEETLEAFRAAHESGCIRMAISTGGELERLALASAVPHWKFSHSGQPRAAVGFSFGLLLAVLTRLKLLPDPADELSSAVAAMRLQQEQFFAQVPAALNPAKRYAGQLMGRWVTVFGSGILAPVARRWKTQINELSKTWAQFEILPEADHNTLAGIIEPEGTLPRLMALFLRCPSDHPRNRLRADLTRQVFMQQGLNTDTIDAYGDNPLAQMWTCLHMGDYVAYYLAMGYQQDPTPVEALEFFKKAMKTAG